MECIKRLGLVEIENIVIPSNDIMVALVSDLSLVKFAVPSCDDEVHNQGEEMVGCGGPCDVCPSDSDIILKLSAESDAFGELYSERNYGYTITYSELFGEEYSEGDPHLACAAHPVLNLNAVTGALGENPYLLGGYPQKVCYGDLVCIIGTACLPSERCVVTLSDISNAKLAKCDSANAYPNKICCSSLSANTPDFLELGNCNLFAFDKDTCLATGNNCTWTPPGSVNNTVEGGRGGCCGYQKRWNPEFGGGCEGSEGICNKVFDPLDPTNTLDGLKPATGEYCAKITRELSYGLWYRTEVY